MYVYFVAYWDHYFNGSYNDEVKMAQKITSLEQVRKLEQEINKKRNKAAASGSQYHNVNITWFQLLRREK